LLAHAFPLRVQAAIFDRVRLLSQTKRLPWLGNKP